MLAIIGALLALFGFLGLVHVVAMTLTVAIICLVIGIALLAYDRGAFGGRRSRL